MATIHVPSNAELLDAADTARRAGMSLYIDGQRCVIASARPTGAGWIKVGVRVIDRRRARLVQGGGAA